MACELFLSPESAYEMTTTRRAAVQTMAGVDAAGVGVRGRLRINDDVPG